jgi:hypothetical protein
MLPDEKVLLLTFGVAVTTERVYFRPGGSHYSSVMLDQVATCTIAREHKPYLAILGTALILLGLIMIGGSQNSVRLGLLDPRVPEVLDGLVVVGLVVLLAYFASRKSLLKISTAGGTD